MLLPYSLAVVRAILDFGDKKRESENNIKTHREYHSIIGLRSIELLLLRIQIAYRVEKKNGILKKTRK